MLTNDVVSFEQLGPDLYCRFDLTGKQNQRFTEMQDTSLCHH